MPVTADLWSDFRTLFGDRGAWGGCWCMWWRQSRRDFQACHGAENESRMRAVIEGGGLPGLLAFDGETPAGWVSLGPRSDFPSLNRSRTLKPIDQEPTWAIVCFYIAPDYRRRGLMRALVQAACEFAAARGATTIEAFPEDIETASDKLPAAFSGAYMGLLPVFLSLGFTEVIRRSARQPIMRKRLT